MRASFMVALLLSLSLTGCLSTVRIKRAPLSKTEIDAQNKQTKVEGIPFYIKVAKCKQETSWLQPVYTLILKKTVSQKFVDQDAADTAAEACKKEKLQNPKASCKDKPKLDENVSTRTQVLSLSQFQGTPAVQELRGHMAAPGPVLKPAADLIDAEWAVISALPPYLPLQQPEQQLIQNGKEVIQISNASTPEALVDYSRVYYYNGVRPWVGSSQVDVKLASDGTLTEGSSQVQSQTLSTILSALPISSVLSEVSKAGIEGAAVAKVVGGGLPLKDPYAVKDTFEYTLTIQQENYKYTHTAYVDFAVPCVPAVEGVKSNYALTVETPAGAGGVAKKDDPNTVKVSGTVVLPSPAATTPAPAKK